MTNIYAVVVKSNEFEPDSTTLTKHTYEAVLSENFYYTTVAATTDERAALRDSDYYYTPIQSAVTSHALSEKEAFAPPELSTLEDKCEKHHGLNRSKKPNIWLTACSIVLIISVIAAAVAVAMAFVMIAGICSDLVAIMKDSSSGSGSKSYSKHFCEQRGVSNISIEYSFQ